MKYTTTRMVESKTIESVKFYLLKMTEGRRLSLRTLISEPNRRIREIMREQADIEKLPEEQRDMAKWLESQDEFDSIMLQKINPAWIRWGVKAVEGLEVDGKLLTKDDWSDWPSIFFDEVLRAVKDEAELNGAERKNFESPTTSGEVEAGSTKLSIVEPAVKEVSGETETATSTIQS